MREFGFRDASGSLVYTELMAAQGDLVRAAGALVTADAAMANPADRAAAVAAAEQAAMKVRPEVATDALFDAMAEKVGWSAVGLINV